MSKTEERDPVKAYTYSRKVIVAAGVVALTACSPLHFDDISSAESTSHNFGSVEQSSTQAANILTGTGLKLAAAIMRDMQISQPVTLTAADYKTKEISLTNMHDPAVVAGEEPTIYVTYTAATDRLSIDESDANKSAVSISLKLSGRSAQRLDALVVHHKTLDSKDIADLVDYPTDASFAQGSVYDPSPLKRLDQAYYVGTQAELYAITSTSVTEARRVPNAQAIATATTFSNELIVLQQTLARENMITNGTIRTK